MFLYTKFSYFETTILANHPAVRIQGCLMLEENLQYTGHMEKSEKYLVCLFKKATYNQASILNLVVIKLNFPNARQLAKIKQTI